MIIKECLQKAVQILKENNIADSILVSKIVLAYTINQNKQYLLVHENEEIPAKLEQIYFDGINKIAKGLPMQYITHYQEFMKLDFFVNENVLIPRPDTENLVEEVLKICSDGKKYKILDLCTGSGAVGISIAHYINDVEVVLSDISNSALKVVEENIKINKVENKVKIVESDMFESISDKFDIIVSNPPYIETDVIHMLERNVQNEPFIALNGGKDGLEFYRIIANEGYKFLNKDGYLCLEIGYKQKDKVINILEEIKHYKDIYYKKDLSGNDRLIVAKVR